MIIVKVTGGLGNQMFQIAFARMLSLKYNDEIYLDCSVYKKYKIREFSLYNINLYDNLNNIDNSDLSLIMKSYLRITQKVYHVFQKIKKIITKSDVIGEKNFLFLSNLGLVYNFDRYYYKLTKCTDIKCVYGYFQSERYFLEYKNQIREELRIKKAPTERESKLIREITSCNSVGVSIRFGDDYLMSKSLNVCGEEYYYRAMEHIFNENNDVIFYIFTDCIDRVKEKFKFRFKVIYVDGFKDYQSLRLLYSCKDFIISNSSFSWWGAYLGEDKNKKVIAPSRWYNDSKNKPDIYLKNMMLIDP